MSGNPRCPICGLYELNDGSEETLWTCECEDLTGCKNDCGEVVRLGGFCSVKCSIEYNEESKPADESEGM